MADLRLQLVTIYASDLERARAFYEMIGLSFERERHGRGPEHLAATQGGLTFEIYSATTQTPATTGVRLGFEVARLEDLLERLLEAGARLVVEPADSPWGRRAVVSDPDDRRVELVEPRRRNHCCG